MATKLTKEVQRELKMHDANGNSGPVIVTLTERGIRFRGKGTQRECFVPFREMKLTLPEKAPAKWMGNPFGYLIEPNATAPITI